MRCNMSQKTRIVVTGMGVVSCLGHDVDQFYQNLLQGKSGISTIEKPDFPIEEFPTKFAGWIKDFDTEGYLDKKQARRVDQYISYTIVAGKKALEMSGLNQESLEKLNKEMCGAVIGSGMGGMGVFVDGVD